MPHKILNELNEIKTFNHNEGLKEGGNIVSWVHTQYNIHKKTIYNKRKTERNYLKFFYGKGKPKDPDYFKKYYLEHKLTEGPGAGRPRSQEAQELGRALNNSERGKKKRFKDKLRQFFKGNQRQAVNMLDQGNIRVKTRNKIPKETDWPNIYEKQKAEALNTFYGEHGARTGKKVKYWGREQYFIYVLDEDHYKKTKDIPEEVRQEIETRGIERNRKWGVGSNKTKHGRHTIILSREPLPPIALQYGVYQPSDFQGLGQQFIVNGPGKCWEGSRKLLIVKDFWELKRKLEKWGYKVLNKAQQIISKKQATNTNIYQQQKTSEIISKSIRKGQEGQTFNIIERLNEIKELTPTPKMREPHLVKTTAHQFRAEFYHKNQAKIKLYQGKTAKLTLKWGHTHLFLNKIWNNAT